MYIVYEFTMNRYYSFWHFKKSIIVKCRLSSLSQNEDSELTIQCNGLGRGSVGGWLDSYNVHVHVYAPAIPLQSLSTV